MISPSDCEIRQATSEPRFHLVDTVLYCSSVHYTLRLTSCLTLPLTISTVDWLRSEGSGRRPAREENGAPDRGAERIVLEALDSYQQDCRLCSQKQSRMEGPASAAPGVWIYHAPSAVGRFSQARLHADSSLGSASASSRQLNSGSTADRCTAPIARGRRLAAVCGVSRDTGDSVRGAPPTRQAGHVSS